MAIQLNEEQEKAVKHDGGVLLNAGAGSGKTRVIIEHLAYLIEEKYTALEEQQVPDIGQYLKAYLSKIVVMTFTKEAAGELQSRMFDRFNDVEDKNKKKIIDEALESLGISTIHSFCLKLIKRGYIFGAPANLDIVDRFKINVKIEELTKQWFNRNLNNPKIEIFLKNIDALTSSMQFVFASPELRYEWQTLDVDHVEFNEEEYFENILGLLGCSDIFKCHYSSDTYSEEHAKKAWWKHLNASESFFSSNKYDWGNIKKFCEVYKANKPRKSKGIPLEVGELIEDANKLLKFVEKEGENFDQFFANENIYREWLSLYKELFNYIQEHYYNYPGMDFSDIEYLTLKSLEESEESRRLCQENFDYIIVDEYQDTSPGQFQIIRHAIGDNFKKLMCVGDRKQAIYGFRGGEIAVFNQTEKLIPQNLYMSNNYRSEEAVVKFNNQFFDTIFGLGEKYQGHDQYSVKVDYQNFPADVKESALGSVKGHIVDLEMEVEGRLTSTVYDDIEASSIAELIEKKFKENPQEQICILYRTLAPSKQLISNLMSKKIPFVAQVKIPYGEDPLVIIFKAFINFLIEADKEGADSKRLQAIARYYNFIINGVCRHYYNEYREFTIEDLVKMKGTYKNSNVEYAFWSFVFDLGLSSSTYKNNSEKINGIIGGAKGDIDQIYKILKSLEKDSYSASFSYLSNANVRIMTTHASKGLEFDTIILGGIHTNGRTVVDTSKFGSLPGALSWGADIHTKKLNSSPNLILEKLIKKQKEFSESKRLFYVACTRAVENIEYFDISVNGKEVKHSDNSWIVPLRTHRLNEVECDDFSVAYEVSSSNRPPIYFMDALGIKNVESTTKLGLISELSVTKLSELALCSRKFYLNQVLKLDEDFKEFTKENEIETPSAFGVSDVERGNRLHFLVENLIKGKDLKFNSPQEQEIVEWVNEYIQKSAHEKILSEHQIKFSFFGQMITGIIDALVYQNNQVVEIWDFKSGLIDEDKLRSYFFQLKTYAFGLKLINENMASTINLKVLALDEKRIIEEKIEISNVENDLFEVWKTLSDLVGKRIKHCSSCLYGNLCHQ